MTKLKTILQFKYLSLIILLLLTTIGIFSYKVEPMPTNEIEGIITDIKTVGNKLTMTVNNYIINYYIDTIDELEYIKNTYKLGDYIKVKGEFYIPKNNTNFNLFNYRLYLKSKKINYICNASEIYLIKKNSNVLYKVKNNIIKRINTNYNKDYLYAFILGNTNYIEEDIVYTYQNNGISHLFAISGMHVSLLSSVILMLLNKIKKTDFNYIITIIFLFFYSFLANYSPSVLRSCFLFTFIFFNKKLKLNIKTADIFIYILSLFMLYNPFYIYNVGFLFSFTISFFLIKYGSISNNSKKYIIKLLITSFIAFLSSIPIVINNFYSLNLLTPLLNLIFVPLVTFIIFPLTLLTFIFSFLTPFLNISISLLEFISVIMSKISINLTLSYINIYIVILYYVVIIFILEMFQKKRYKYGLLIYIILLLHSFNFNLYDEIHMLDIGQGDSILIRLKHNQGNILIDTGGITSYVKEEWKKRNFSLAKNTIIPYLKSVGVKKIDYLVLTHGDFDHLGEAIYLIDNFRINNVLLNSQHNNNSEQKIISKLENKNINYLNISKYNLNINGYKFDFINKKGFNENNDSLIIYTKINNKHILLMGDADINNENYLLKEYKLPKMDILKVGHHGSKYSSDINFLKYIKPGHALISAGLNNKFNHPHKETLDSLNKLEIPYYITSINGSIKILLKNDIEIYTCS